MAITIPPTMKAWTFSHAGSHRQVLSSNTVPSPKAPTGDQVLIKVAYSGLNYGDIKGMTMVPSLLRLKNSTPAFDYSGMIMATGPLVPANLAVGTRVFGVLGAIAIIKGIGTLCEYICISSTTHIVAPVPENWSLEDAGCIAIGGTMAFLICKYGGIKEESGLRMLVNGASGGCGSIFVQAAKAMGAKEIVATCSTPNFELVKSLGAHKTIDYRNEKPLHSYLAKHYETRKFDIVIDTVGAQELYTNSPAFLKEEGIYVNIGDYTNGTLLTGLHWVMNCVWPRWLGGTPRKFVTFGPQCGPEAAVWLSKLMAEDKVKAVIDRSFAFDQVLEAFDIVASKRTRGRIVVKVADG